MMTKLIATLCLLVGSNLLPAWGQSPGSQDFDYARLAHPEIAEFLELSDAQRTEISRWIADLAAKVAVAPEADRKKLNDEVQGQIRGLLTPEQLVRLEQLPELRKLKFNFGSPKWEDVLRWFAKQADLSLVMSTPPSGPFNYTDNREYTPSQAIDLLNSILLTKGFTLVRRDKLLILVEINDGVPDEILPRVTLDELDKRGTFELVSILFSLGDKPPEAVMAEVKPMLGNYGKMASLPNSKQLLVTETVGKIRAIKLLIDSVPSPPATPTPEKPAPPEPPILQTFALGRLDPKTVSETLKQLAPGAVVTCDVATDKVVAFGPPAQIAIVKSYLEQLTSGATLDGMAPHLKIYPLTGTIDSKQLLEQLLLVTPQAKISHDPLAQRLLVFATPPQQEQVQATLVQLQVIGAAEASQELQVFRLSKASPTTVQQLAQAVAPRAAITADAATSSLVVRAAPSELVVIRQLVEQLERHDGAAGGLILKSFPLARTPAPDLLAILQSVAPRAKIQADPTAPALFVMGTADDLAALEPLVQQFQSTYKLESNSHLVTYDLTPAQKSQFQSLTQTLVSELGTLKVVSDPASPKLTLWGTPQQHEFVKRIVDQLQAEPDQTAQWVLQKLEIPAENPEALLAIVRQAHPTVQLSFNSAKDRLIIWAHPADQAKVQQMVERLLAEMPAAEKPAYETYDLGDMDPAQVVGLLQPLAPEAKLTVDAPRRRLTVLAKSRDHETLRSTLQKLDGQTTVAPTRLGVYALSADLRTRFNAVLAASARELSQVKVLEEQRPGELAIMATEVEHTLIQQIVTQLNKPVEGVEPFSVVAYPIGDADPALVSEWIQGIFKGTKVVPDPVGQRLLIWAPQSTHADIGKSLEEFGRNAQSGEPSKLTLQSYRLQVSRASTVVPLLQKFLPRMQLQASDEQGLLVAWGRAAEHEKLKLAIEQINVPEDSKSLSVEIYPTGHLDPQVAAGLLTKMFPEAVAVPQSTAQLVTFLARGEQQKLARKTLEQLSTVVQNEGPLSVAVYRVERSGSTAAMATIQPLVPQAKLVAGAIPSQFVGLATARDQMRIEELVTLLESDVPDLRHQQLRAYQLRKDLAGQVRPILQGALPNLKMIGTDPGMFAVWATEAEHERLKGMIEEAERELVVEAKTYRSYQLEKVTPLQARTALVAQLASLAFVDLSGERTLTVLATAREHEQISQVLQGLELAVPEPISLEVASYEIPDTSLPLLIEALPKELVSRATIKSDVETNSLIVSAEPDVQNQLRQILSELPQRLPRLNRPYPRIYPMDNLVAKDWQAILLQLAPTASVATDPGSGSLVVTARSQTHEQLTRLMEEFRRELTGERRIRAYRVSRADLQVALQSISALVPNSKITADTSTKSLLAVASENDHATILEALEQIDRNAPSRALAVVYSIPSGDAASLALALKTLVPSGSFVAESTGRSILALATEDEQVTIKATVDQWALDPARKMISRVYPLNRADPQAAVVVLQRLLPGATIAADLPSRSIAATATEEQHRMISETVGSLDEATQAAISRVYPANGMPAKDWQALMAQLAPGATVATDPATNRLVITARPQVHQIVDELMIEFRKGVISGKSARAFKVTRAEVAIVAEALASLIPNAKVTSDKLSRSVVVVADETDMSTAQSTIDQLDRNAPDAAVAQVYSLPSGDASALATALKTLVPGGAFVAEATGKTLLALASPEEQTLIKSTVEQWTGDPRRALESRVYPFERGDPQAAATALQKLLPGATFAVDATTRALVATANQEQHELVRQTVTALDMVGQKSGALELRSYVVNRLPAESMAKAIRDLFKSDSQVSVSAEKDSRSIIAVARPNQHEMIQALVNGAEQQLAVGGDRLLKTYPLTRSDGKTFVESLTKLFEKEPFPPQVTYDASGQRVLALGSENQHVQIQKSLEEMRGEAEEFDVFRLQRLEVSAAESALRSLFRDEPRNSAPSIDVDYDNQSLLIRATASQLARARELLIKLGETQFGPSSPGQGTEGLRVIPMGADVDQVWQQLEQVWPRLRPNELRVISPEPHGKPPAAEPLHRQPDEPSPAPGHASSAGVETTHSPFSQVSLQQRPAQDPIQERSIPGSPDKAPVIIFPEAGRWLIASSDTDALNQLEQLLSVIARSGLNEGSGRNFQIFSLRNAGAGDIADLLKQLFKDLQNSRRGTGGTPTVITSDDRLNIVIVHGSRADREVVASLLKTLDSPDLPDAQAINQPVIVPVRNTDANRILTILNNIYRTQLSSGGGRKQISIPEGISADVATVLQQVNAATSGPVLTLGVDTTTNAIIVMAPQQLRDQVRNVVQQLDKAVETEPGEQIEIIQFRSANPNRIQKALDVILKDGKK